MAISLLWPSRLNFDNAAHNVARIMCIISYVILFLFFFLLQKHSENPAGSMKRFVAACMRVRAGGGAVGLLRLAPPADNLWPTADRQTEGVDPRYRDSRHIVSDVVLNIVSGRRMGRGLQHFSFSFNLIEHFSKKIIMNVEK